MGAAPERAVCSTCSRVFSAGERFCPYDKTDLFPTPPRNPDDPLVGTVLGGSYTLLSKFGGGGMGVVYRARQNRLRRDVALKILSPSLSADSQARERFKTEALAVSQLTNSHTVSIYDFGSTEDGLLYLVMQLLEGESLRARLGRGPLSPRAALSIAAQICESLAEAHSRTPQIVHRDIKPDNVIIRRMPDGEEVATVLDFGLAKLADTDRLTMTGLIVGTPAYMAPEQARNDSKIDARVDLYSLGVLLHEMICGRQPFSAPNPTALLYKHVWEPPPTISVACPGLSVPAELETLVLELLAKNPEQRVQTAGIARARLLEILRALPADDLPLSRAPTLQSPMVSPVGSRPPMMVPLATPPESAPTLETTGPVESQPTTRPEPLPPSETAWVPSLPPRRPVWVVPALIGAGIAVLGGVWWMRDSASARQPVPVIAPLPPPLPVVEAPPPAPVPVAAPVVAPAPVPVVAPPAPVIAPEPAPIEAPPHRQSAAHPSPARKKKHSGASGGGEDFPVVPE